MDARQSNRVCQQRTLIHELTHCLTPSRVGLADIEVLNTQDARRWA